MVIHPQRIVEAQRANRDQITPSICAQKKARH
jgi:hypothetical protein